MGKGKAIQDRRGYSGHSGDTGVKTGSQSSGGLAFFVRGASSKMAPLQIKHRLAALAIFLIFLKVLFDTLLGKEVKEEVWGRSPKENFL